MSTDVITFIVVLTLICNIPAMALSTKFLVHRPIVTAIICTALSTVITSVVAAYLSHGRSMDALSLGVVVLTAGVVNLLVAVLIKAVRRGSYADNSKNL
jgi:uncharacterized membrane-anchored protein YitT (DUF2179 family)